MRCTESVELVKTHFVKLIFEAGCCQVLYGQLGEQNKKMVFLFTDQHVVEEGFLELINNMLTSGMVPALYADEEKESIIGTIREEAIGSGLPPTREALWQYFVSKCSNNLHVVMAMSPVGDLLRSALIPCNARSSSVVIS